MLQNVTQLAIDGTTVNVASIDDLILLKKAASCAIDLSDIELFIKIKSL